MKAKITEELVVIDYESKTYAVYYNNLRPICYHLGYEYVVDMSELYFVRGTEWLKSAPFSPEFKIELYKLSNLGMAIELRLKGLAQIVDYKDNMVFIATKVMY